MDQDAPYAPDITLDEEVIDALIKNDPNMIWSMVATLATMDTEEWARHRAAIKNRFNGALSIGLLDKAIREKQEEPEEDDDPNKIPPNAVGNAILENNDLLNVGDNIYAYDGKKWSPSSISYIQQLALRQDGESNTTKNRRSEISSFISSKIYTSEHKWRQIEMYEVPVANGVIDIRTMEVFQHRKEDYIQTCIPWEFKTTSQCPTLMTCLDTYFGGDDDGEAKILALQEFFGYCLMPHARYKMALLCVGESDCGKSTIPFLLRTLLGRENIAAVGVEHMDDPRKRAPLLGKLVNLLTELTSDAMIADGGFKTLVSTEEPILFDVKWGAVVMDVPICKHVIVTNTKPKINDKSNATYRRLLLLHFNHVIPKLEQDTLIWDKLALEIDGILSWALEGAQRLYQNGGRFTDPGSAEVAEYRKEQNPMQAFMDHCCEVDPAEKTRTTTVVERFKAFHGGRFQYTPASILQMARDAGLIIEENPTSGGDGKKYRHILGVKVQ